jgi:hypothetical protein
MPLVDVKVCIVDRLVHCSYVLVHERLLVPRQPLSVTFLE